MEIVYFYSLAKPLDGVIGEATLDNGVLKGDAVSTPVVESLRKKYPDKTDTELFGVLNNNFTQGLLFTLRKPFPGSAVADYIG